MNKNLNNYPPKYIHGGKFPNKRIIYVNGREKYCKNIIKVAELLGYFLWRDNFGNSIRIGNPKDVPYNEIGLIYLNDDGNIGVGMLPLHYYQTKLKRTYLKDLIKELKIKI